MQIPTPSFEWQITSRCNYNCTYCCQGRSIKNKGENVSEDTINSMFRLFAELPGTWLIKLIGGEASIHPRFYEICRKISQTRNYLCMTTNFSTPLNKLKQLINITGDRLYSIGASVHLEQISSYKKFIEKAIAFNSMKHPTTDFLVTSVCTEKNFDLLKNVANTLENEGIRFEYQWLKSEGKYVEYPQQIEQFISNKLIVNLKNTKDAKLFGTLCHSGELFFRIDLDGSVRRCYNAQPLYDLGNINKGTFRRLKEAKPCMAKRCDCTTPANRGMILFGQKAGKYAIAKTYCESWLRRLRNALY